MKKLFKSILAFGLALCLGLGAGPVLSPAAPEALAATAIKSVKMSKRTLSLSVGKSSTLKFTSNPKKLASGTKKSWKSSKPSVAAVSKTGKVSAKKTGVAVITVTVGGKKATCVVTVKAPAKPTPTPVPQGQTYTKKTSLTGKVSFSGSTSVYPAIAALTESFKKMYPKVTVEINNVTGSGAGLLDANNGTVSFGMRSSVYKGSGDDKGKLNAYQIAWDGVAIVANLDASTKEALGGKISTAELAYVYSGSGSPAAARKAALDKLVPIDREDGSGTRTCFQDSTGKPGRKTGITVTQSTDAMKQAVKDTTNGIGYISLGSASGMTILGVSKSDTGAAIAASTATVLDGTYPISRPFVLLRLKSRKLTAAEKEFLTYALSKEGQDIIIKSNFEPLSATQITAELAQVK